MDRTECLALLESAQLGRLACARDGQPYVVPVSMAVMGEDIVGFSLEGQKVEWMRANPKVCIQVDEFDKGRGWRSVVAYGRFEELPDRIGWKVEREKARSVLAQSAEWWLPGGLKPVAKSRTSPLFFRIVIDEITGRRAQQGD
ncbi:MAG: pyridoxamine 5'-phosphate oxidase family protein [Rhizobiaceae bacterium]|nr:pyridoxamine 5'-phosphate oxidase family protein [Rhizobiaceae bacterium]